jgi:hypothetical protein
MDDEHVCDVHPRMECDKDDVVVSVEPSVVSIYWNAISQIVCCCDELR